MEKMERPAVMKDPAIIVVTCAALCGVGLVAEPAPAMPVSALAALSGEPAADVQPAGWGPPFYGYSYGPQIYFGFRDLDRPILSLDGGWLDRMKRKSLVTIKSHRVLIH
jgi:hypothetical protein